MSETLELSGLSFEVRRSARRRTLALTVDRGGELVIHSPTSATEQELMGWARRKLLWVHRKLALKEELALGVREPEFVNGENFYYLGRCCRLAVNPEQDEPLTFDGRRFHLRRGERRFATGHFRRWYSATGKEWIEKRVWLLSRRVGCSPSRIEIRDLGFRWGSCGKNGVVFFNWKMLQLGVRLVDYLIVHELSHLIEPHHGPQFWRVLDCSLPDWRERKEELQYKAREIYWCRASTGQ